MGPSLLSSSQSACFSVSPDPWALGTAAGLPRVLKPRAEQRAERAGLGVGLVLHTQPPPTPAGAWTSCAGMDSAPKCVLSLFALVAPERYPVVPDDAEELLYSVACVALGGFRPAEGFRCRRSSVNFFPVFSRHALGRGVADGKITADGYQKGHRFVRGAKKISHFGHHSPDSPNFLVVLLSGVACVRVGCAAGSPEADPLGRSTSSARRLVQILSSTWRRSGGDAGQEPRGKQESVKSRINAPALRGHFFQPSLSTNFW